MALTLGDIVVNIKSDTSQLTKGFKRAESTVSKASKTMVTAIKTLTVAYIGLNAIDLVGNLVKQADAMTLIDTRLKLATKSTEELVKAQKELFDISQEARVGFSGTVDLFERITRSTKDYGTSQKEIIGLTETINKAMVISGGTAQSMNAAIIQLGQAFSADFQAVGQELASIREQAPRLYQALLEGTELSSKAFKKHAEDGKLSTQIIIDALKTQAESVGTEFEKVNLTVDQSQTQLQNSSLKIIGMFDEMSGASSFVAESISDISKSIDELTPENIEETTKQIKVAAITIVAMTVGIKGYTAATALASSANILMGGTFGAVNRAIIITTISTKALSFALKTIPFVAIAGTIAVIADAWLSAADAQKEYNKESDKLSPENLLAKNRARVDQLNELIESNRFNAKTVEMWKNAVKRLNDEYDVLSQKSIPATKKTAIDIDLEGFSESIDFAMAQNDALLEERVKNEEAFLDWYDKQWEKENKKLADRFSDTLTSEIQNAFSNVRDFDDFADAFSSAVGSALAKTVADQANMFISLTTGNQILGALGGGIAGAAVGIGFTALTSLFGGDDGASESELAEERFNSFMDGLDSASEALEQFGNVGSSISGQIESLQSQLSKTESKYIEDVEAGAESFNLASESTLTEEDWLRLTNTGKALKETYIKEINDLNKRLSETITSSLADTLDISALTTSQLEDLTAGIDIQAMEAYETELNNIALAMKIGTDTAEDITRATEILSDVEFAKFQDFAEAFDLLAESVSESQKAVNDAMLGSLSYLSDVEKLNFANNIFQTATTSEDRISSSRTIAEISRGTTRTREDYAPIFQQYLNELQKEADEATTQDVVDKLDEVILSINASTESATEDAIYGT